MSTPNDGGPAFPLVDATADRPVIAWGMSLRDWFAGQALAAIGAENGGHNPNSEGSLSWARVSARRAYEMADAMIAARTVPEQVPADAYALDVIKGLLKQFGDARVLPDHACAECVPHSELLIVGFRCPLHRARALVGEASR